MFSNKHIRVFVSLGVVIMMMLHLVIPHAHHHHEDEEIGAHSTKDHQHTESHHHHPHKDHDKNKDPGKASFSLPSEKHLHAYHVHEFVTSSKKRDHASLIKVLPLFAVANQSDDQLLTENEPSYRFELFRPILYENPYLLNCSPRAPPYSA